MDFKRAFDRVAYTRIRFVAVPTPPSLDRCGMILMPDSFTSDTFDGHFDRSDTFRLLFVRPSEIGPLILMSAYLKDLISVQDDGVVSVRFAAFCASISFYEDTIGGKKYGLDVKINKLNSMGASCHPGSHIAIPRAPFLTAVLQHYQAKSFGHDAIEYLDPTNAELLFPEVDFSKNGDADDLISVCHYKPYSKSQHPWDRAGIGMWTAEYLRVLRNNANPLWRANNGQERNVRNQDQENGRQPERPSADSQRDSPQVRGEGHGIEPGRSPVVVCDGQTVCQRT